MSDSTTSNVPAVVQAALAEQKVALKNCNLMLPTQTFGEVLGMFDKVTIEVVTVNPDPEAGDVFPLDGKGGNKLALGKVPLQKIANALGILWDPKTTTILESSDTKSRAKATGAMRKPNGEYVVVSEEKTVDLGAIEEEQRLKIEDDAQRGKILEVNGKIQWEKTDGGKSYPKRVPFQSDAEKAAWIDREVRKVMLSYRKFKDERAMTGAKERVIRAFLAIKGTYSRDELARPFAFPRVTLDAAKMLASPETRAAAVEKLTGSVVSIFGPGMGASDTGIPEQKLLQAPPVQRTVDPQTGDVIQGQAEPAEEGQGALDFEDDFPGEPEKKEPTPEESARAVLQGYLARGLPEKGGWKTACDLIRTTLADPKANLVALNSLIDRCTAYLQKRPEGRTA